MKKLILALTLWAACSSAFAQGRVTFINDSLHLFVLGATLAADNGLGGGTTNNPTGANTTGALPIGGTLPSGVVLVAALYSGTSSSSLVLQSTSTLLTGANVPSAGRMAGKVTVLSNVPGNTTGFFQILVWDSAYPNIQAAYAAGVAYIGASPIFTAVPSTSAISAPNIVPGTPSNSTWPNENIVIGISLIPEPTSVALVGMGGLVLIACRRRGTGPNRSLDKP